MYKIYIHIYKEFIIYTYKYTSIKYVYTSIKNKYIQIKIYTYLQYIQKCFWGFWIFENNK